MGLTTGLSIARSALFTSADQTSIVGRNVANAGTALYTRKSANVISVPGAGARVVSVSRTSDTSLLRNLFAANSDASAQKALLDSLNQLDQTVNDPELDASPAALISKLADAVQQYASQPHSELSGQAAVTAARNLVTSLNSSSGVVQNVRRDADAAMADAVDRIDKLLVRFEAVNNQIVTGTRSGTDVSDFMDTRDTILSELSTELGIRTVERTDNDMAIYTDSGITLFDKSARTISFDRSLTLPAGTVGNAVYIDGVPVTGASATMPIMSGRIKGLVEARDEGALVYQRQLDEIARGLIEIFAESDQSAVPSLPDVPGLFTYPGAPAMPATGTIVNGLASLISVNANVDPSQGGVLTRLRDGGISDPLAPEYIYNTGGTSSFSDRLSELTNKLNNARAFDGTSDLDANATIFDFASSSVAWLQEARKIADNEFEYRETLYQRSTEAYSKVTGVNLDEEMTILLELERSYQTSSKLVSVIDSMFDQLVQAVG
jgi:flagellar hook-associated protein 1 FlgK